MVDILTQGNTQIFKFNAKDKKDLKISFNYAIKQGGRMKGFKTLTQVNRALGNTGAGRTTSRSFRRRK